MTKILRSIEINSDSYVGYIVKLKPTEQQIDIFNRYFIICKYVYNLGIDLEEEYCRTHNENYDKIIENKKCNKYIKYKYMNFIDLNNKFNELKKTDPRYQWLIAKSVCDATTMKLILQDVVNAYTFDNNPNTKNQHPKKKDDNSDLQFPTRAERITIDKHSIRISSIGWVKYYNSYGDEIIGTGDPDKKSSIRYLHYVNPRISFNGIDYILSFSLPKSDLNNVNSYNKFAGNPEWQQKPYSEAIGIDVGLRRDKWIVDSTGYTLVRPSNDKENIKIKQLNQKLSRQLKANNKESSKNIEKTTKKLNKYYKKIINRRKNEINNYTNRLLDLKPEAVIMESMKVGDIIIHDDNKDCNSHKHNLNNLIKDAALFDSIQIIEKKLTSNGIPVMHVTEDFPSTQLCSRCHHRYKPGKEDIYRCPNCGLVINKDYNAALNLASQAYVVVVRINHPVVRLNSVVKRIK